MADPIVEEKFTFYEKKKVLPKLKKKGLTVFNTNTFLVLNINFTLSITNNIKTLVCLNHIFAWQNFIHGKNA